MEKNRKFYPEIITTKKIKFLWNFLKLKFIKDLFRFVYHYTEKKDETYFSFDRIIMLLNDPKPYGSYYLLFFDIQVNHFRNF